MNPGAPNGRPSMYVKQTTAEKRRKAIARILRYTKKNAAGCWIWQRVVGVDGYGHFHLFGKQVRAHRASYTLFKGDPGRLLVCHKCDVTRCVNPDHLFLGTPKENMRDMVSKGRGTRRLTDDQASEIRARVLSINGFAKKFGVAKSVVKRILRKKTYLIPVSSVQAELFS